MNVGSTSPIFDTLPRAHPQNKCACLLNLKYLADDSKPASLVMMKIRRNLSAIRHPKAQTLLVVMVMKQSW